MAEREQYPMTSTEAKALEASMTGGGISPVNDAAWASMATEATTQALSADSAQDIDAKQDLVGDVAAATKKSSMRKDEQDDMYSHFEREVVDEFDEDATDDPVLDVPLEELRGDAWKRFQGQTKRALLRVYKRLYGDKLPPSEMLRTLSLATTLFFIIGGYWLLRSLKDTVLISLCGVQAIPKAKMLSVFVVLGVVSVYNKLLDSSMPKHQIFYVFGSFYFLLFCSIALMLMNPTIGLANKYQSESRILGWMSYCSIESFSSVMVSLFWSFANSNVSLETAKASYGVMVAMAQLGSITGPAIVNLYAKEWGVAQCFLLGALASLLLQGTMYMYVRNYGTVEQRDVEKAVKEDTPTPQKNERAGILEGLVLFWRYKYVKGIFVISCVFMVEGTIIDFTLKMLAKDFFSEEFPCENTNPACYNADTGEFGLTEEATNAMASFMGLFGVATNSLSFVFSLMGTSAIIRYLGLRSTLLLFPTLCFILIIIVRLQPTLYVVFFAMMMLKANSYALNNPTKELLYQTTSSAVRYKAKSWIDIFGARGTKALGSVVTNAFSHSAPFLVANGTLVGIAVSCFLMWNARFMGKKFDEYTESGYIVGEENNPDTKNIELAMEQNTNDDTSCAIMEDEDSKEADETAPKKKAENTLV
jgi:ATP:ADP antiporter, AAA family